MKPQLIVIDVAMPLLNRLDAGQQIKQMLPSVQVCFSLSHKFNRLPYDQQFLPHGQDNRRIVR